MTDHDGNHISRRRLLAWGAGATVSGLVHGACSGSDDAQGGNANTGGASGGTTGVGGSASTGGSVDNPATGGSDTDGSGGETSTGGTSAVQGRDPAAVSVVRCNTHDATTVHARLKEALDSLGDLSSLVQGKVVGVKPNLTGSFDPTLGMSAAETYITHGPTMMALTSLLFEAGARRVRVIESISDAAPMTELLGRAGWDVSGLMALGDVQLENTRNLGSSTFYSRLAVPDGRLYTYFDVNSSYEEIDVMVSVAKMKNHRIAGVTLTMKNLFGITPLPLYGTETELGENALGYRGPTMHDGDMLPPGEIEGFQDRAAGYRVPRIVVDQVAARPIDLAIVEGITTMSGGEGPWHEGLTALSPGLLIAGWNPVATDAVATKIMGYDPMGTGGVYPGDNHILLAHQAGLGSADTSQLDVRGLSIDEALFPFG